ncbi:MAG: hypothetical protein Q4F80_02395 [bacterium]|nr:hypothetical protein [bacterium]
MALKRKVRQAGNSLAYPIPNEVFEFFNLDPKKIKYKLCQDETGSVFILILQKDVIMIDEKKFQKLGNTYAVIIPKPLCTIWDIGLEPGRNRELEISYGNSPLKWLISPV